ncbi:MAG: pantetheine-phosphate adenylyltransferase [Eubacteriaceae bacterium]|nr:pantetheine-phosphate adenylyltransferase [Eubacteriaceae bacterium]
MSTAVYPGSFDPITNGHLDIIWRASKLVEKLYVAVLVNRSKKYMFTAEERVNFIKESVKDIHNIEVVSYDGLLVDFCREKGANAIFKGLRAITDYEIEVQMALMNKRLENDVETVLLVSAVDHSFISSSIIKEVAFYGGDIAGLVPEHVKDAIIEKWRNKD